MIGWRTVEAHNNGDCWSPSCPICEIEDDADRLAAEAEDDA